MAHKERVRMLEKKKDLAISIQTISLGGRFRDYNRNYQLKELVNGIVHSFWKQKVSKKPQVPVQFGEAQQGCTILEPTV